MHNLLSIDHYASVVDCLAVRMAHLFGYTVLSPLGVPAATVRVLNEI
jgi:hypothetical protein